MSGLMLCGVTGNSDRVAAPAYSWNDTDAQTYYTNVGYTNTSMRSAVDTLAVDAKASGAYTKQIAIYPFTTDLSGGTSAQRLVQMKWNFKDPRDLDAAKRIAWVSAPNATMNGVASTAFGQYGATKVVPSTDFPVSTRWSMTFYILDATLDSFAIDCGAWDGTGRNTASPMYENSSPNAYVWTSGGYSGGISNNQNGLYTFLVNGSTFKIYRNGSVLQSGAITSGAHATIEMFVGGINLTGSFSSLSTRRRAFLSFGDGSETDGEIAAYHTAINTYQGNLETAFSLPAGDRKKY